MVNNEAGKKWYQKPESLLTYGGLAALGYGALNVLDNVLPLLNRVLENTLYTAVLGGSLALLGFLVVNKDVHRLVWYGWKSAMRWVTGRFVELDPIGIMQSYIAQLRSNLDDIATALGSLKGQARDLEAKITEKEKLAHESMGRASYAKKQGNMETAVRLQMRKGKRAEELGLTYQGLLNRIRTHIQIMGKVQEAANFMVLDIEDTVESETEKRKMIRASYKAMSASRAILAAGQQREMYDMAMEAVTQDYYSKLGEIEQFMDDSKSFIQGMDLENGAYDAEALSKLEEWEQRSTALLEGGTGNTKFRVTPATIQHDDEDDEPEITEKRQSYADLFGKLDK